MAEFAALRAEIDQITKSLETLLTGGLAGLGILFGFVIQDNGTERLLLLVPAFVFVVCLLWTAASYRAQTIGSYIRTVLWPYLTKLDRNLPSWEEHVHRTRVAKSAPLRAIFLDFAGPLFLVAIGCVALVQAWSEASDSERTLCCIALVLSVSIPAIHGLMVSERVWGRSNRPNRR